MNLKEFKQFINDIPKDYDYKLIILDEIDYDNINNNYIYELYSHHITIKTIKNEHSNG